MQALILNDIIVSTTDVSILQHKNVVYELTLVDGRKYVGKTTRKLINRIKEHCSNTESLIGYFINHYGMVYVEILSECDDAESLTTSEQLAISNLFKEAIEMVPDDIHQHILNEIIYIG